MLRAEGNTMEEYKRILELLLIEIEQHPEESVESVLDKLAASNGWSLSDEAKKKAKESFAFLDLMDEKRVDLSKAKDEGMTRHEWLQRSIDGSIAKLEGFINKELTGEQKARILNAINKGIQSVFEKQIKEVQP